MRGDALPAKPSWAGDGGFWAPDVSRLPDGRYLMYFTGPSTALIHGHRHVKFSRDGAAP